MRKDYETLLRNLAHVDPPKRLYGNILARIEIEQTRKAKIRFVLMGTTAICSLLALVPAVQYTAKEFSQSGFLQYLSLIFSDSATIMAYWKEFTFSLAESLPAFGITMILSILFVLFGSIILVIRDTKTVFMPA